LTQLESLWLNYTTIGDRDLAKLQHLIHLRTLSLGSTGITDDGLLYLRGMRSLFALTISRTDAGGFAFEQLDHLPLQVLQLNGCPVFDVALLSIARLSQLKQLDISRTHVTDEGMRHHEGLKKLKALRSLRLDETNVTGSGFRDWSNTRLRELSLRDCPIDDNGMEAIGRLESLYSLDLSNTPVNDSQLHHLTGLLNLIVLYYDHATVSAPGLSALRRALPKLSIQPNSGQGAS
jgi:Leucine-rich repeat (LRR) protein